MMKTFRSLNPSLFTALMLASTASFGATMARGVGSGIVFPALNSSPSTNPAGLSEAPKLSIGGQYDLDQSDIYGSAVLGHNGFGAGFNYQYVDASSTSIEAIGAAAKLGPAMLGAAMTSAEFANFDANVGLIVDLKKLRLASVVTGLSNDITSVSVGIGGNFGMFGVEFDVSKLMFTGAPTNLYTFNAGAFAMYKMLSFGVAYDFSMTGSEFAAGDFKAGLSVGLSKNFFVEGFYNTFGEYSAGLRFTL